MFKYLENLRKKPEAEKKKSVLKISLCITLIIAAIWGVTLFFRIENTNFSFSTKEVDDKMPSISDTFSNFFNRVGNIVNPTKTYSATSTESK